jgi:hypothetical protein
MNKNQQIISRYLPKKNKARMNQMDTILIRGGNTVEQSCQGNGCGIRSKAEDIHAYSTAKRGLTYGCRSPEEYEIMGKKSIKSSEETGDETNEFVHVILSELTKYKLPIIVKIHDSDSYFVEKELFALDKLADFENSVTKICDFSCMDDKSRWKYMIDSPVTFCNNKRDKLHFIALEYIENGEMDTFFSKNHSNAVLCSLFLQIEASTSKSRIHYQILEKEYRITSHGIIPKLIDYGRCTKYVGKIYPSYVLNRITGSKVEVMPNMIPNDCEANEFGRILDDIYTCLSVCAIHIKNTELKHRFQQFILTASNHNTQDLHKILVETKQFFD